MKITLKLFATFRKDRFEIEERTYPEGTTAISPRFQPGDCVRIPRTSPGGTTANPSPSTSSLRDEGCFVVLSPQTKVWG